MKTNFGMVFWSIPVYIFWTFLNWRQKWSLHDYSVKDRINPNISTSFPCTSTIVRDMLWIFLSLWISPVEYSYSDVLVSRASDHRSPGDRGSPRDLAEKLGSGATRKGMKHEFLHQNNIPIKQTEMDSDCLMNNKKIFFAFSKFNVF